MEVLLTMKATIVIHQQKAQDPQELIRLCPFGAIVYENGKLEINAACRMCKLCVKNGPAGVFEFVEMQQPLLDKEQWRGIAVYVEHTGGTIHPVTYELIGKAIELNKTIGHPVYALFIGSQIKEKARELLHWGVDAVYVYDQPEFAFFRIEPYSAAFEDFISLVKPSTVLVGGTSVGRSLAPRIAARFRSGLTADCTRLEMQANSDLDQIRPAFGGNIMAHIRTPNHRPQFATVRYKIFSAPPRKDVPGGELIERELPAEKVQSNIQVLATENKPAVVNIEDAQVIVVAGRGVRKQQDMTMIHALAERLSGQVAATRPLIEAGWADARCQIGLSGRTVSPQLLIACGVSGSVQFTAGMTGTQHIVAINFDPNAPIFRTAHIGLVGDLYEILPLLMKRIEEGKDNGQIFQQLSHESRVN